VDPELEAGWQAAAEKGVETPADLRRGFDDLKEQVLVLVT
jgi:hypothetical protein